MICGLLGRKLGHSYSPQIHGYLGNYNYDLFEKEPEEIPSFLKREDVTGLNVTIPYKKEIIPYLDHLTDRARKIGAVNTVVRQSNGSLIGHNTDYFGFLSMLTRTGLQVAEKKVLVLGSGGASATVTTVLEELGATTIVISRSGLNNYDNLHLHADASVIVNTTPVGMYPNTGISPADLSQFPQLEGVLDVVYNPARTKLLLDAERRGLVTENGLWMLVAQAKESAEWFTGAKIPDSKIAEIHRILQHQMENLILIGMPGCGKSTVGKLLAQVTGKTFYDADAQIVSMSEMGISEIFEKEGEAGFRCWETAALAQLCNRSGLVIATGGGCVTRQENYDLLHQNGKIVWLQRDLDLLPTDGRPLSQAGKLSDMYQVREPLYRSFADYIVGNHQRPEDTVNTILGLEERL